MWRPGSDEVPNANADDVAKEVQLHSDLEEEDDDNEDNEEECQVCLKNLAELYLEPCGHKPFCERCYEDALEESTEIYCPICLMKVTRVLNVKEWEEIHPKELDWEQAKTARKQALASTVLRKLLAKNDQDQSNEDDEDEDDYDTTGSDISIFEVSEQHIINAFGTATGIFFVQTRWYMLCLLLMCFASSPMVVAYLGSVPKPRDEVQTDETEIELETRLFGTSRGNPFKLMTMLVCTKNTCPMEFWYPLVDSAGALIVFLISRLQRRYFARITRAAFTKKRDWDMCVASRCVAIVQARHLQVRFGPEDFHRFGEVSGVVSGSARNLVLIDLIERRRKEYAKYQAHLAKMEKVYSKTKSYSKAQKLSVTAQNRIRGIDRALRYMFREEKLNAISRRAAPVQYGFVLFKQPQSAQALRDEIGPIGSTWRDSTALMFGAPSRRFALLGTNSRHETFVGNIHWPSLKHPYLFTQSGWPMRVIIAAALSCTVVTIVGGYAFSNVLVPMDHIFSSAFLVVMQVGAHLMISYCLRHLYRHPVNSYHEYFLLVVTMMGVYIPCTFGWMGFIVKKEVATENGVDFHQSVGIYGALEPEWWNHHALELIQFTLMLYLGLALFHELFFRILIVRDPKVKQIFQKEPYTQHELNEQMEPGEWTLSESYVYMLRTMVLVVAFSGVIPALLPVGAFTMFLIYGVGKILLIHFSKAPPRAFALKYSIFASHLFELSLIARLVITAYTMHQILESDDPIMIGSFRIEVFSSFLLAAILFYYWLHCTFHPWFALFYSFLFNLLTLGKLYEGCFVSATERRKTRLKHREAEKRAKRAQEDNDAVSTQLASEEHILRAFDVTQHEAYSYFFQNVTSIEHLAQRQSLS